MSDHLVGLRRSARPRWFRWPRSATVRRHPARAAAVVVLTGLLIWLAISLGGALTNPALGSSVGSRFAEWARSHGVPGMVNWVESEWYRHHQPQVGGTPPVRLDPPTRPSRRRRPPDRPTFRRRPRSCRPASPPLPGEGQWSPAGRLVGGVPAVYVTTLRPDPVHTSYVVGAAWMDTKLLRATLYSGSQIPGGGPYSHTAPVSAGARPPLVAAFNAGFLMSRPTGATTPTADRPSAPVRGGLLRGLHQRHPTVGQWGRDATMSPDVVVRPPEPRPAGGRG